MATKEITSKPTIDTQNSHVSIREYRDEPISHKLLKSLVNAARRSPTSSNMQAYTLIIVQNQDTKNELARLAGNQRHIETCGAFVAVCADISRLDTAVEMHGSNLAKNLENTLVSTIDAALVGMSLASAAESVGLGTCMIGGIRNNPKKVAELLDFPKGVYVVFGMTLGWPDWEKVNSQKPRLQEEVIIHWEKYKQEDVTPYLKKYDQQLQEHYQNQGRKTPDAAWTGIIERKFSTPRREHLRDELEHLGFSFL